MQNLKRQFFARKPEIVAKELLGKFLVRKIGKEYLIGKIVEAEAYLGKGDKASHSHRGQTKRNAPMFGPAGYAYIYFTYGMHWLLNFVTEGEGKPSGVLIRAVEPIYSSSAPETLNPKIANGPAKLTKWMNIDGELNGTDITRKKELFVVEEFSGNGVVFKSQKIPRSQIISTARVGVDYAAEHKDLPLRFYIKENKFISRK